MASEHVLHITGDVRADMEDEARARYPEECCGGLLGQEDPDGGRSVIYAIPGKNTHEELRERRYILGPDEVLRMLNEAESRGLQLLGFFHSHPDHPAQPSETDRELAWPWYSYIIVSVRKGEPERIRSWRLDPDRAGFTEEEIDVIEGPTEAK